MSLLERHSADMRAISHSLGFFEDVLLISGDVTHQLRGRFVLSDMPINPGSVAPVASSLPVLSLRHSDVVELLNRELTPADKFRIRGQLYAVQQPRVHGQGWLSIRLKLLGAGPQAALVGSAGVGSAGPATGLNRLES